MSTAPADTAARAARAPAGTAPAPRPRRAPRVTWGVRAIAAGAALVAAASDVAPTGLWLADRAWAAGAAAAVTLLASRATRATWLWMTGLLALVAVGSWALAPAAAALALAATSTTLRLRPRVLGAAVGALAAVAALHLPPLGPRGATALVVAVAVAPALRSGYLRSPRRARRAIRRAGAAAAGGVLLAAGLAGVAAALCATDVVRAIDDAQAGLDLVGEGDQVEGGARFDAAARRFERAEGLLAGPLTTPARVVPVLGQHVEVAGLAAARGADVARSAEVAAATAPYHDLKADEGRVDLDAVRAMQGPVHDAAAALEAAHDDLTGDRSPWLVPPVADVLDQMAERLGEALPEARLADRALTAAPGLLGGDRPVAHLVLFTSPAETRNLGGFTGSYGVLTADGGQVDFEVTGAVSELARSSDWRARSLADHPEFVERYGRYQVTRYFQNLTASPDMGTTAAVAASLYEQTTGVAVDGVVVVDPHGLAGLLELTGPVEVDGLDVPLTSDNAARYLLHDQYLLYDGDRGERKDRLEDAGRATFEALTERRLPGPREIGRVLGPLVDQKRILAHPFDEDGRALMEDVGALGRFAAPEGSDLVALRTANARPNKIDVFLHRALAYEATYDPGTGEVRATATITLRNDAPTSGLPPYVIGPDDGAVPLGTTQLFATLYTPLAPTAATLDGEPVPLSPQREQGLNALSRLVTIPAGGTARLVIELEGHLEPGQEYRLLASAQPVANPDHLAVTVAPAGGGPTVSEAEGLVVDDGSAGDLRVWDADVAYVARLAG